MASGKNFSKLKKRKSLGSQGMRRTSVIQKLEVWGMRPLKE